MLMLMVDGMLWGLLLHLLGMRLLLYDDRGWRLLKHLHLLRRFANLLNLLLLLVRFDFDRWGIRVGRYDRSSAGSGHFCCGRNSRHHLCMMWRRRKMWWRLDDGLQRTAWTGVDELMGLLTG